MLEAAIKSDILKEFSDVLYSVVEEVKLSILPDGIKAKAIDPSHIAMVDLSLSSSVFEVYKATECQIGLSLKKLNDVIKLTKSGDIVKLEYDGKKNYISIIIGNLKREMGLLDPESISDAKLPSLTMQGKVIARTEDIKQAIKGSESISEQISLIIDSTGLLLESEGDSSDKVSLKIGKEDLKAIEAPDTIKSTYPIDYFSNMVKAINTSDFITMSFSNDYPLQIDFSFADGNGTVKYLLAPRTSG
ncbi:MAG: DNA polymerase sliding clamp [Thermoplasmata archaeon]